MKKNIIIRIPKELYVQMLKDLRKPHHYAGERVGFLSTKLSYVNKSFCIVTITAWETVPDDEYMNDPSVGAKISGNIIRREMENIICTGQGKIHVHLHDHHGSPTPSYTDLNSLPEVAAALHNANPNSAVGYLILSQDSFFCKLSTSSVFKLTNVSKLAIVGYPFILMGENSFEKINENELYYRQSFLGKHAQQLLSSITIGIVGVGGGGSHIAQQLAHIGVHRYMVFDHDHIEESNHNRLIGGWFSDIKKRLKKTLITKRLIKKISPQAQVIVFDTKWQEKASELNKCDIVIGCVDSYTEREQLEASCRRFLIPYIDIGMDVYKVQDHGFSIAGQVILSMPGSSCLRCMQFITEKKLAAEAAKYSAAGNRPQVVWPNGILASTAVGILVDLITGWTKMPNRKVYLSYDGELGHIIDNPRIKHCCEKCTHYDLMDTGDVIFITA